MDGPSLRIGPFELRGVLGRGGMGTVWDAVHVAEGVPAAIKTLHAHRELTPAFRASFRAEVRAAASLDHPHIALVLDHGEVTPAEAAASDGKLRSGAPYLAMERVDGGSLSLLRGRIAWRTLQALLLQCLDALAHAHAAGVIHRDIKPGNVLFDGSSAKLVDFGIAHHAGHETDAAGTPGFMAPEQFLGDWRELGPTTDLYAVGCLGFVLAAGVRPFDGTTFPELLAAHTTARPRPLRPRIAVPDGFEGWLLRLLRKSPSERYQRAADAAWALHNLGSPTATAPPTLPQGLGASSELATLVLDPSMHSSQPTQLLQPGGTGRPARAGRFLAPLPRFPRRWQRPDAPPRALPLLEAGLGLFGLRHLPMVGRTTERDLLWEALRAVRRLGRARAVVLRGPSGCGKTRLSSWLGRRAHELGVATPLRAVHAPEGGPADGVAPMLARWLRCVGLEEDALSARVRHLAPTLGIEDAAEVVALADLLGPRATSTLPRREDRHAVVVQVLRRLCVDRPLVWLVDDAQWGADAVRIVLELIAAVGADLPVLAVLTVRTEALPEAPEAARLLEDLEAREGVQAVEVEPLGAGDRRALVQSLLRLAPGLAHEVERRTDGNPLFAVQLVGDWVQRGWLESGPDGFTLAEGVTADIPDDLHAVWAARLARTLGGRDPAALELAAVLGLEVAHAEWRAACAAAGLSVGSDVVERLIDARLARAAREGGREGWRFVHAMLRESLVRQAHEAGRLSTHHAAAAAGLATLDEVGDPARIGRHQLQAGQLQAGVASLLEAQLVLRHRGELDATAAVLAEVRRALDGLGADRLDARRLACQVAQGWVQNLRRDIAGAIDTWEQALALAREAGDRRQEQNTRFCLGIAYKLAGRLDDSVASLRRAAALAEALEDAGRRNRAVMALASSLTQLGRSREALPLAEEAHTFEDSLQTAFVLAGILCDVGQLDRARSLCEEGARRSRAVNDPHSEIGFESLLGSIARLQGDPDEAWACFVRTRQVERAMGRTRAPITEVNMALVEIERGRHADARQRVEELLPMVDAAGRVSLAGVMRAVLLPCLAEADAWAAFDRALQRGRAELERTGIVEPDVGDMARLAAETCRRRGQPERADAADALARAHSPGARGTRGSGDAEPR